MNKKGLVLFAIISILLGIAVLFNIIPTPEKIQYRALFRSGMGAYLFVIAIIMLRAKTEKKKDSHAQILDITGRDYLSRGR